MDNNNEKSQSKSPTKSNFSMSYLLSPLKSPATDDLSTSGQDPRDQELTKAIHGIFNTQLIAAMINRDTVLREVRDCVLAIDEERCKKLCKQIHAQWQNLSTHNGFSFKGQQTSHPHAMKEPVMEILHATHPGAWGMTELGQRLWWPFIYRDLINKIKNMHTMYRIW